MTSHAHLTAKKASQLTATQNESQTVLISIKHSNLKRSFRIELHNRTC